MELDKVFIKGNIALAMLRLTDDGEIAHVQIIDHYRTDKTIFLGSIFIAAMDEIKKQQPAITRFGLVLVAPLTVIAAGMLLGGNED